MTGVEERPPCSCEYRGLCTVCVLYYLDAARSLVDRLLVELGRSCPEPVLHETDRDAG